MQPFLAECVKLYEALKELKKKVVGEVAIRMMFRV